MRLEGVRQYCCQGKHATCMPKVPCHAVLTNATTNMHACKMTGHTCMQRQMPRRNCRRAEFSSHTMVPCMHLVRWALSCPPPRKGMEAWQWFPNCRGPRSFLHPWRCRLHIPPFLVRVVLVRESTPHPQHFAIRHCHCVRAKILLSCNSGICGRL